MELSAQHFALIVLSIFLIIVGITIMRVRKTKFTTKPPENEPEDLPLPTIQAVQAYYHNHKKNIDTTNARNVVKKMIIVTLIVNKQIIKESFDVDMNEYKSWYLLPFVSSSPHWTEAKLYMSFTNEPLTHHNLVLSKHPDKKAIRIESLTDPSISYYLRHGKL